MLHTSPQWLSCNQKLTSIQDLRIMGILNITPDSFFDGGQYNNYTKIKERITTMVNQGVDIVDMGGYSSRPGAEHISEEEEWQRLKPALEILRKDFPKVKISIDTFRSEVAEKALKHFEVEMINDISGGNMDDAMADVVAKYNAVYVLMHMQGTPQNMQADPHYTNLMTDILTDLQKRIDLLEKKGVKDIIVDPGFGFGKTLEHNYAMLSQLKTFNLLNKPVLVGVSRKSMFYKLLGTTPAESLNATTVAHTIALMSGASILRVHDVREAKECVRVFEKMQQAERDLFA